VQILNKKQNVLSRERLVKMTGQNKQNNHGVTYNNLYTCKGQAQSADNNLQVYGTSSEGPPRPCQWKTLKATANR